MVYQRLKKYWNIQKPIYLSHPKNWDGVSITSIHEEKKVLKVIDHDEIIVITPEHKGTITRAFGDLLTEEVV